MNLLSGQWVLGGWFFYPTGEKGFSMRNLVMCVAVFGVAAFCMAFGCGELFAQTTPTSVTFEPIVNFGDIFTSITTALGPIVAGALGLGLAIWGARYVFGVIKSMGR